jgi:acyl carrier protein
MRQKIIDILQEIRPEFDFIEGLDFIEEGMLDSFDIVSLVTSLDERFNISIDGMDILPENFASIDSIVNLLINNGVK